MRRIGAFLASMAGRIFMISVVGAIVSATIALAMATAKHRFELQRVEIEHVTDRVQDFYTMVSNAAPPVATELIQKGIPSFRPVSADTVGIGDRTDLTPILKQRLGTSATAPQAIAERADGAVCIHVPIQAYRSLGARYFTQVDCWLVTVRLPKGPVMKLAYLERRDPRDEQLPADPIYFLVLIIGVGLIALRAARLAAAPLHALSKAATALGDDLDRSPLPEGGPSEVRTAAKAFNSMQRVLRRHVRERHQMLASITHDLQTPLTRLRLRAEKVQDGPLRERMIADLASMQLLIREGLELARGDEAAEPPARFDLNSLLESLAADAVDAGFDVRVHEGASLPITARPQSLRRTVSNLIQNALKYAGSAELLVSQQGDALRIIVRDHGPGIPPSQLDAVFEPFVRLESSRSRETGGVGLGLTIARRLAERSGGSLELVNRPEGGLDAVISLPLQVIDQAPLSSSVSSIRLPAGPAAPGEVRRPAKSLPLLR